MRTSRLGRNASRVVLGAVTVVLLAACAGAAGQNNVAYVDTSHVAGFWAGLWQGLILPIAFVVSLFTNSVSIYEVHNNGNWYDFGYVLGVAIGPWAGNAAAGSARGSRRTKRATSAPTSPAPH